MSMRESPKTKGRRDERTKGRRDEGTQGLRDAGTCYSTQQTTRTDVITGCTRTSVDGP